MTIELVSTTPGLYSLPDWAKQGLSDLRDRQKHNPISGNKGGDIVGAYDRTREEVASEQTDTGLDRVVGGQFRWNDMPAHPLMVHEDVETGDIVHYYGNNNFYRDPQVSSELAFSGDAAVRLDAIADLLGGDKSLRVALPGLYSLPDFAADEYYSDEAKFPDVMGEPLAGEIDTFPDHETLFFFGPLPVFSSSGEGVGERVPGAILAISDAADADMVAYTYWGTFDEKVYVRLIDADVDAIGFNFVADGRDQTLYNVNEYGTKDDIALGLADGRNMLAEDSGTIRERVEWTLDNIRSQTFDTAYVISNTELFYLPENRAAEKLAVLAAITGDELKVGT